jgi:hypothetical protein
LLLQIAFKRTNSMKAIILTVLLAIAILLLGNNPAEAQRRSGRHGYHKHPKKSYHHKGKYSREHAYGNRRRYYASRPRPVVPVPAPRAVPVPVPVRR